MSQRGYVIDGAEFARRGGYLEGVLDVAACPRLGDAVADAGAPVTFSVRGEASAEGDLFLILQIGGELRLRCQRCLGVLRFPLQVASRLRLVPQDAAWPDEDLTDDACDAIALERTLDVASLAEEEIVLALPIAPRHDTCAAPAGADGTLAASPLAALGVLKGRGRDEEN